MKKKIISSFICLFCFANVFGQRNADLERLVATEKAFAQAVETKGIKAAFIEYLTEDGVMFNPVQVSGREVWNSRPESPALLSRYPVFADVSSNGVLGYTTGPGEYRPKGKSDSTVYYSEYATIWRRQPDGSFKAALDVGISHEKPTTADTNWTSPKSVEKIADENKPIAANAMSLFFDTASTKGLNRAYKTFAAEEVRFLREGKFPIIGKSNFAGELKNKSIITFGKQMILQSAGDLGYAVTTYEMKSGDHVAEKGNVVQIWKLLGGRWQIVLDVFAQIPLK
jgi:ketosteroid isomerase-like protein